MIEGVVTGLIIVNAGANLPTSLALASTCDPTYISVSTLVLYSRLNGAWVPTGLIRLTNVAIHVSHNIDGVPMSYPACGEANCNIVFGSNNTAMVVENTYAPPLLTATHILSAENAS